MDEFEQKIIQAVKEEAIKDILKDEECKMRRRNKIFKIVTTILSAAAVLVMGIFVFLPANRDYKAIASNYINDISYPDDTPSRDDGDSQVDSCYKVILSRLKDTTETDKTAVIKLVKDFQDKFKNDDEEYSQYSLNISYIMALCYLYNGDVENAKSLLQELNNTAYPEWYFKTSVGEILAEIK